jgi:hypothetical protein
MEPEPFAREALSFRLLGWSAWTETLVTSADWREWADAATGSDSIQDIYAEPGDLPMMARRRATPVGRKALGAAMALPGIGEARFILSSRHGELNRSLAILTCLAGSEPVSPADFSMSVHHGLVGVLSIAVKNTRGHSAVSAGPESFCYGMMEAAACLAENPGEPVILVHYDEKPDTSFPSLSAKSQNTEPVVAALSLGAARPDDGAVISVKLSARDEGPSSDSLVLDFLRFLQSGAGSLKSRGSRLTWEWVRG